MIVAIDVDAVPAQAPPRSAADGPERRIQAYVRQVATALLWFDGPVQRLVLLTNPQNHARFETLRDERCDVAMIRRPLFGGRTIHDWSALLSRHPRAGAELLAAHLQEKLKVMRGLGAGIVHFPADAAEAMDFDAPVVISLHDQQLSGEAACPLSATLAHSVLVSCERTRAALCATCRVSRAKTFVAPWPGGAGWVPPPSSNAPAAGEPLPGQPWWDFDRAESARKEFAAAICDAYEHALASFELKNAA